MTLVFSVDRSCPATGSWLSLAVRSARAVLPGDTRIVVLTGKDGFATKGCEYLDASRLYAETFKSVERTRYSFHGAPFGIGGLGRMMIPLLFDDPVAYCDADVEFVGAGFASCVEMVGDHEVAMVPESPTAYGAARLAGRAGELERLKKAGLPIAGAPGPLYYNSGMVVFNPRRIRENHPDYAAEAAEGIAEFVRAGFALPDQDFCNQYFDVKTLPPQYNAGGLMRDQLGAGAFMLHYLGTEKVNEYPYPPEAQRRRILDATAVAR
ncbi:MAG: hypothetical protein HUJ63_10375 [Enterococcus sp.]|nr:hypothetical protein [Enterococcus sp.]